MGGYMGIRGHYDTATSHAGRANACTSSSLSVHVWTQLVGDRKSNPLAMGQVVGGEGLVGLQRCLACGTVRTKEVMA